MPKKRFDLDESIGARHWLTANIVDTYGRATLAERADGTYWYPSAHALAKQLGGRQGAATGAGVIAALSPATSWDQNQVLAVRAFTDGRATGHTGLFCSRADAILGGADPLDVLGGDKVRAFYACILDPSDPWTVCVDRHAYDIAIGYVTDDTTRKVLARVGAYDHVAQAYRDAADVLDLLPSVVQAVTWVAWRARLSAG